jgi:drug/metabolite transporter (DMT)-like permease
LLQKRLVARYAALDVTTAAIGAGILTLLPLGGGLTDAVRTAPLNATVHLIVLGVFPGALGYVLWTWCFSQMPVARLMMWLYLVAPLSVLMSWAFLGELPSSLTLLGGAVTLAGVMWTRHVSD